MTGLYSFFSQLSNAFDVQHTKHISFTHLICFENQTKETFTYETLIQNNKIIHAFSTGDIEEIGRYKVSSCNFFAIFYSIFLVSICLKLKEIKLH